MLPYTPDEAIYAPGPWTHRDVSANGGRFHLVTAGEGPLVLMLHGFPMFWYTWRHLIPELADAGYRAAAMDLRGYGGSDHTPRGYDLPSLSRDVAGVIRSLGEREAVVIGHGIGGLLAWTTAALHPGAVSKMAAISVAHPLRMRQALVRDRAQLAASSYILGFQRPWIPERNLLADDAAQVGRYLHEWSGEPSWPDTDTADRYRAGFMINSSAHCSIEYHRWALRSIPRPDGRRYARDLAEHPISAPVLHIHGNIDSTVLPRTAEGSREYTTGPYAYRGVPCGHFPQEEIPGAVNPMILDWLAAEAPWSEWSDPLPGPQALSS